MDFVINTGSDGIPLEVREKQNLQAKNLKVYPEKYEAKLSVCALMADYKRGERLLNLPLWAVETMGKRN